jgi:hypothetical protein
MTEPVDRDPMMMIRLHLRIMIDNGHPGLAVNTDEHLLGFVDALQGYAETVRASRASVSDAVAQAIAKAGRNES